MLVEIEVRIGDEGVIGLDLLEQPVDAFAEAQVFAAVEELCAVDRRRGVEAAADPVGGRRNERGEREVRVRVRPGAPAFDSR